MEITLRNIEKNGKNIINIILIEQTAPCCWAFVKPLSNSNQACLPQDTHSSSSSSSRNTISLDIPGLLSAPLRIVHRFRKVLKDTPRINTELLYCLAMWMGAQDYITYEFAPTSPAVSCMSRSSNFDSVRDGW